MVYLKGQQLLETIEASQNMENKRYEDLRCPGFAQVSGMEYVIDTTAEYDKGEEYGNFFKPASIQLVTIPTVNGEPFDPEATYAVVADNMIMNGGDTYSVIGDIVAAAKDETNPVGTYINNGNGVLTRNIVEMYIEQVLGGVIPEEYAAAQGRIRYCEGHQHTETINSVVATCTTDGYTGDLHCMDCDTILEYGTVITKLSETGEHSWTVDDTTDAEGWKVVAEPTEETEGLAERVCSVDGAKETKVLAKLEPVAPTDPTEPTDPAEPTDPTVPADPTEKPVVYSNITGNNSEYKSGSDDTLKFSFERSVDGEKIKDHFTGVYVDDKKLSEDDYTIGEDKFEVELKSSFLKTLGAGNHTLRAEFDDGEAALAAFTVAKVSGNVTDPTGNNNAGNTGKTGNTGNTGGNGTVVDNSKQSASTGGAKSSPKADNTPVVESVNKTSNSTASSAPATGDNNHTTVYTLLAVGAACTLAVLATGKVVRRKD